MGVAHAKTLVGPGNGNSNQIQPPDWNDPHVLTGLLQQLDALTGLADMVLTFDGSGNAQLLPKSSILTAVSPNLTGTPTAPTAALATNSDQIATTAFVQGKVAALIASAPGLMDTLDEIAAALGDDPNFAATMTTLLALKAPLANPAFTGNPTAPNQTAAMNNTRIANTAYADAAAAAAVSSAQASVTSGAIAAAGSVVGSVLNSYATYAPCSTAVPLDDTIPTISEGDQLHSQTYTPKSAANKLRCRLRGVVSAGGVANAIVSIFQGSTNIGSTVVSIPAANAKVPFTIEAEYTPGVTTLQTITVRCGGDATIYVNGISTVRQLGGAQAVTLVIEEIKG